ncbi:MAG TPA: hypothetical protein PKC24_00550 [Cyclobacteriaceae bacterium]|nr:hypothetical protein [Cyclobacteriaceae bacterium]
MKFRPDEAMLIAYLYDELEQEEKLKVEAYLQEHPEMMHELQSMQSMRMLMRNLRDKEVIEPPIIQHTTSSSWRLWEWKPFRAVASIAASLLILLAAGKFSGLELNAGNGELRISFGAAKQVNAMQQDLLSKEDVNEMISHSLKQYDAKLDKEWSIMQASLDESIQKNLIQSTGKINTLLNQASSASQEQIAMYVEQMQTQNMRLMQDYLSLTAAEQKLYMEDLLVDFAAYLQQQRNNDIRYLQARMNFIEEDTDLFKLETEQILSSIVSNVSNTNNY